MNECYFCGDWFCDGDCAEAWLNYTREQQEIADHVAQCTKESCYVCECM